MSDPLQKFVQQTLSRGMPKQELQEALVKAGWPRDLVLQYLGKTISSSIPSGKPLVRVQGVTKRFDKSVLDGLSVDIMQGEIFGIIGASGSGKTTLLMMLAGCLTPDAGDVTVFLPDGPASSIRDAQKIRGSLGFASQSPSVFTDLTVEENLLHFAQMYGLSEAKAKQQMNTILRLVGLQDSKLTRAGDLSGGMQKRLDIACAIVHDPSLLVLDEPVADLDTVLRTQMWDLLKLINKRGTTIVIASHFLTELESVCSRMGILRKGKLAEVGTPDELRVIYSHNQEVRFELVSRSHDALLAVLAKQPALQIAKTIKEGASIKLQTGQPVATIDAIVQYCRQRKESLVSLEMGRPTVRELFEELLQ